VFVDKAAAVRVARTVGLWRCGRLAYGRPGAGAPGAL